VANNLNNPIRHSSIPTMSASSIASSVYSSLDESTIDPSTFDTSKETSATGPTASWRDEPKMEYMNTGTKPVSVEMIVQ
jgi:hypothetical protein